MFERSAIKGDPGWRINNFEITEIPTSFVSLRSAGGEGEESVACDADEEITFAFHVDMPSMSVESGLSIGSRIFERSTGLLNGHLNQLISCW